VDEFGRLRAQQQSQQLTEQENEMAVLERRCAVLKQENHDISEACRALEEEAHSAAQIQRMYNDRETEIKRQSEQLSSLQQELRKLNALHQQAQLQLDSVTQERNLLLAQVSVLQDNARHVVNNDPDGGDASNSSEATKSRKCDEHLQLITRLHQENAKLESQVSQLELIIESQNTSLNSLQDQLEEQQTLVRSLKATRGNHTLSELQQIIMSSPLDQGSAEHPLFSNAAHISQALAMVRLMKLLVLTYVYDCCDYLFSFVSKSIECGLSLLFESRRYSTLVARVSCRSNGCAQMFQTRQNQYEGQMTFTLKC
jgi:hypothetical protein